MITYTKRNVNRLTGMITCRYGQIIIFDRSLFEMGSVFKLIYYESNAGANKIFHEVKLNPVKKKTLTD